MSGADPILVFAPTVTVDTSANASGDNIGGKLTLNEVLAPGRPFGMVRGVTIVSDTVSSIVFDVFLYSDDPSGTTFTTNGAQSIASGDQPKLIGVASCSEVFADGACSVHQAVGLAIPFVSPTGRLWASIVGRGNITFGATTDVSIRIHIQQAR